MAYPLSAAVEERKGRNLTFTADGGPIVTKTSEEAAPRTGFYFNRSLLKCKF
jgi:hypothetical protein